MLTFILYILGGLSIFIGVIPVILAFASPEMYVQYYGNVTIDMPLMFIASGVVFFALGRILFVLNDIRDELNKDVS
tara:strand:+ start:412 stop:639 length:228 start_codon:yes stop_codon:yes gene_type:complete